MFLWIMEICTALTHYVTAYATQIWFFERLDKAIGRKNPAPFIICRAYGNVFTYHFGSLAFGSILIGIFRVPLFFLRMAKLYSLVDNMLGKCIHAVCAECLLCFANRLSYLNKYAWMDVAI